MKVHITLQRILLTIQVLWRPELCVDTIQQSKEPQRNYLNHEFLSQNVVEAPVTLTVSVVTVKAQQLMQTLATGNKVPVTIHNLNHAEMISLHWSFCA